MIFRVKRTHMSFEQKPCEEAKTGKYIYIDERWVDDPQKLELGEDNGWFNIGSNHRVENGHIKRDLTQDGWLIEINTLDELCELCKKYDNELVFDCREGTPVIEIYDYYRE